MNVIVTGSASGIGLAIAERFLREGHVVFGFDRQESDIKHPNYRHILQDIRSRHLPELPEIAVLVNAAGFGVFGPFAERDLKTQLDIIDLNDRALTAMCHLALPYLAEGSRIYNMGSMSSWQPVPYINVYGASKAYVLSFSRALGVELQPRGVRVMAVCPGWITTEFFDHAVTDDTICYYNRYYGPEAVVNKALRDMKRGKTASVLGFPERMQARLVKFLPVSMVMKTWCKQQKQPRE